jgi:hypothetical protein
MFIAIIISETELSFLRPKKKVAAGEEAKQIA